MLQVNKSLQERTWRGHLGVLQSRFTIVRGPVRYGDEKTLANIMKACKLMHNVARRRATSREGFWLSQWS